MTDEKKWQAKKKTANWTKKLTEIKYHLLQNYKFKKEKYLPAALQRYRYRQLQYSQGKSCHKTCSTKKKNIFLIIAYYGIYLTVSFPCCNIKLPNFLM